VGLRFCFEVLVPGRGRRPTYAADYLEAVVTKCSNQKRGYTIRPPGLWRLLHAALLQGKRPVAWGTTGLPLGARLGCDVIEALGCVERGLR
jgi:hypothetical protein